MSARVLLHVQPLLGSGHLVRTARIARALAAAGFAAHVASGGGAVAAAELGDARLHRLPTMRVADASFSVLLDEAGRPIDEAWRDARRDRLLALFDQLAPEVLVTELFPFGRRQCRFELLPLLEAAWARNPRPLIVASLRDILQAKRKPGRAEETAELVERRYDLVLIHGDPRLAALADSYPLAARLASRLRYTGYVAPDAPPATHLRAARYGEATPSGEVIVSAGGSGVGLPLLEAAPAARLLTRLDAPWRLLLGGGIDPAAQRRLLAQSAPGLIVEPARADFLALLAGSTVSASQAGYNTVMDVLTARARAVLVPFVGDNETEQSLRAERMAARLRGIEIVPEAALTPELLAAAIDRAAAGPRPDPAAFGPPPLDLDGAKATARLLAAALAGRA